MPAHDVFVQGAGVVGLAAALALARQGLRVALLDPPHDQSVPKPDDVRAYALNPASVRLLEALRVWEALPADARTAVHDMHIEGDAPGAALEFSSWSQGVDALAWIVDAAALEAALRTAARFAPHIDQVSTQPPAALRVFADGRDSPQRQQLGIEMPLQPYGHRAIAARLSADIAHANVARQWFRSPDVLALLPLDRPVAGHGLALVWSVPDARADELMALSDAAFETVLADATGFAAGHLSLASARAQWPLAIGRAAAVSGDGWVLVGDAAHVVHPLAGQGLNLGLGDVAALAEVAAAREPWRPLGDPRLLRRYARLRAGPTREMSRVTDALLQLFARPDAFTRELRNRGLALVDHLPPLKRFLTTRALGG